jgi:hypothetical protein
MKLDQIDLLELLYFQKYGNLFLKIILNYINIVLTIKSLQYLKLFSFILIINMNPLMKSYIFIKENNKLYKLLDFINYFIFIFIIIIDLIVYLIIKNMKILVKRKKILKKYFIF